MCRLRNFFQVNRRIIFEKQVIVSISGYRNIECNLLPASRYLEIWYRKVVILDLQREHQRIQMDTPCHAFGNTEVGSAIQIDERSI